LSDRGSAIIRRYGILNEQATGRAAGIPHPGTFILDRNRRVKERQFEESYQVRRSAASLLAAVDGPASGGRQLDTKYLAVTLSASDAEVAPGRRFSVVLDVAPKSKIHVYAPGQENYIPIKLTLDPDPAYTIAGEARYPKPGIYFFKPLNERFKVYSRPFRIGQDVVVSPSQEVRARAKMPDATLTVKGTLSYQACDDEVCYLPVEAPVSWTLKLKTLTAPEPKN
jgi:hypothetical protein